MRVFGRHPVSEQVQRDGDEDEPQELADQSGERDETNAEEHKV